MRLSLLRAPLWPDSLADRGPQHFQYAVYPHAGDWRSALTERRGQEFNWPLVAAAEPAHDGVYGHSWSFATVAAGQRVCHRREARRGFRCVGAAAGGVAWPARDHDGCLRAAGGAGTVGQLLEDQLPRCRWPAMAARSP